MSMLVSVEIQNPSTMDEQVFGTARAAINWVKGNTKSAVIKLDGHTAYKYDNGKLLWNNGSSFELMD